MRRTMEKTGLAVCVAFAACSVWADSPTVSDAAGLVEALEAHNAVSGSTTIYLEPGNYVFGGSLSTMQVSGYFDNHSAPVPYAVDGSDAAEIAIAGDWFASGECDLYVNGALVARSTGPVQTYALPTVSGAYRTYELVLRAGETEERRFVTVFPHAGFACSMHTIDVHHEFLDARPAGTFRKVNPSDAMKIAWSGLWNEGADRSVVTLYRGMGTGGECLGELVDVEGVEEGVYRLCPDATQLEPGRYTLTHFDGVEPLVAYLGVKGAGLILLFK